MNAPNSRSIHLIILACITVVRLGDRHDLPHTLIPSIHAGMRAGTLECLYKANSVPGGGTEERTGRCSQVHDAGQHRRAHVYARGGSCS